MASNHKWYHRQSIRLPDYDYSQPNYYFITICTKNKECLFGEIKNNEIILNELGKIVEKWWLELKTKFLDNIELDEYIVMPNHFHGIIFISPVGAIHESPLQPKLTLNRRQMLLSKIIGYFKMNSAKYVNQFRNLAGVPLWQRNYYEHIIRDENSLNKIRNYIISNPLMWEKDRNNTENLYF